MSTREFDVAVAGAGIMGLACAFEEARRGGKVLVAEARGAGQGASGAAAGLLVTRNPRRFFSPFREFTARSVARFPAWIAHISGAAGVSVPLRRASALHLYHFGAPGGKERFQEDFWRLFREEAADYEISYGLPPEVRGLVRNGGWAAIRYREEWSVDPSELLAALKSGCEKLGVEIRAAAALNSIREEGGRVALRTGEGEARAGHLIIAAGAESDRLLSMVGYRAGFVPVKGQAFLVDNIYSLGLTLHYNQRLYLSPMGRSLYAGTTKEKGEWDPAYRLEGEWRLREEFNRWLRIPIPRARRTFSGLRPRTRDRLPLIGFVTPSKAVSVCAGHYKSGIALAPLSAASLSSLIHGESPPFDISPFDPWRPRALKALLP